MDRPAQTFKYLLAEAVAVTGGLGRVVGSSVTFDSANEPTLHLVIEHSQIHPVAGNAYLRHHTQPASRKLLEHLVLERRFSLRGHAHSCSYQLSRFRKPEVILE